MKKILLLVLFCCFLQPFIYGQSTGTNSKIRVDTVMAGSSVFVGDNVVSFTATFIIHGICLTRSIVGPSIPDGTSGMKHGDVIIVENIIANNANGKQVPLPPKKFIIK